MDTDPALMDEFQKPPSEMLLEFKTDILYGTGQHAQSVLAF